MRYPPQISASASVTKFGDSTALQFLVSITHSDLTTIDALPPIPNTPPSPAIPNLDRLLHSRRAFRRGLRGLRGFLPLAPRKSTQSAAKNFWRVKFRIAVPSFASLIPPRRCDTILANTDPRSSGDRAPASGAGCAGSNPAGGVKRGGETYLAAPLALLPPFSIPFPTRAIIPPRAARASASSHPDRQLCTETSLAAGTVSRARNSW